MTVEGPESDSSSNVSGAEETPTPRVYERDMSIDMRYPLDHYLVVRIATIGVWPRIDSHRTPRV